MKLTTEIITAKFQKSAQKSKNLISNVQKLQKTCKTVKNCSSNVNSAINSLEILFNVFKQSIEETESDKKYFLEKLKMFNEMGEALDDYLSELVDVAHEGLDKDNDEPDSEILTRASTKIKKGIRSLERVEEILKKSKMKKTSKLQNQISELKNQMSSIRKTVKADGKKKKAK